MRGNTLAIGLASLLLLATLEAQGFEDGEDWKGPLRLGKKKVDSLLLPRHARCEEPDPSDRGRGQYHPVLTHPLWHGQGYGPTTH
ncbi:hypothetical protein AMTR_s00041p00180610 [Amborella trichopoda]|uniref:Uncharacterized protein n=1 Tax=Amborella trichopoda TaxID=13333 RepID=W1PZC7_AMBTC|nr:hypothetical protein AMTR_s00041p00180610 [Amborella trichopoda]